MADNSSSKPSPITTPSPNQIPLPPIPPRIIKFTPGTPPNIVYPSQPHLNPPNIQPRGIRRDSKGIKGIINL